ncbi:MAG TPA: redoxin family protein [Thermoanaerobaculia bacterium]
MNRKVLLIGLAVVIPVLAILVLNLGRDPHRVKSPLIGAKAPTFTLRAAGSQDVISLEQLRGRPVVVNFWATWCVPCYAEHEVLTRTASATPNIAFVGVAYDDTEPKIIEFLRQYGSAYPTAMDSEGKTAIAYGVYGVPETFFVNAAGTIVVKHEGPLTGELMTAYLSQVIQ